ncbi:MAG: SurA N-terminal domain-containing protein [Balneolaceae bacterium]|nr:SurA N-terminal domain-containing protein [Balneolaceae bacterium]
MGVMTKFRDNTGIILWILIGSFGLLWVIMDVYDPNVATMGPRDLGEVNGEPISLDEYNSRVQYYTNAYSQQSGAAMTPEIRAIYENQVWDELVSAKLLEQKMDELGITVTDSELLSMAYGDNPDPLIMQYFSRPDGTVDRFAIQNVLTDPTYSQEALAIEIQLRQKRRQEKLSNFITAGLQVTDQQVIEEFNKRNSFASVSYLRFPYSEVTDAEIEITDADVRTYYNENKELFKTEESYRAQFVTFSTLPTAEDSATIRKELEELREDFAAAENDSLFLIRNQSTTRYNNVFVQKDEIREDYAPVLDVEEGEVTGIINLGTSAAIIKNVEETRDEIKFAVMSLAFEALPSTVDGAFEAADEFLYFATEESSFDEEANRSGLLIQEAFATKGNTFVSGVGSSQQVLNFLETSDEGDISDPIELATQFVIIRLTEVNEAGYRPMDEVRGQIETQVKNEKRKSITVEKVQAMIAANGDLESLSAASGKDIQNVDGLAASAMVLTGAGREPKVIGSVFAMQANQLSPAIEGVNGAYVIYVNSISEPAPNTLDDATASSIRAELEQQINQKYLAVWLDQLKDDADIIDNRSRLLR